MYNIEQQDAIFSEEKKILIVAPPGSGKTHTMTGAIKHYIDTNNFINDIVAITFTNKATNELKERLFDYGNVLHISTIHSWSFSELKKLSKKHGFRIKLLEEEQILAILEPFLDLYGIRRSFIWSVYHHCLGNANPDLSSGIKRKYDAIKDKYIAFKRKRYLYDFTDLPLYLKTKLEDYDEYIKLNGIFVDEFQDVDPIQLTIFDRVISPKKFFIGDPDQAIFIFRGATEEIFNYLTGYSIHKLYKNYRSYQLILDYATNFKQSNPTNLLEIYDFSKYSNMIIADRGSNGGKVFIDRDFGRIDVYSESMFFDKNKPLVATLAEELKEHKYHVLCRTNKQVKAVEKLGFDKVSTIHKAKGLEYDNVIVLDFEIQEQEDLNVGYVALTRAKNRMIVIKKDNLELVCSRLDSKYLSHYSLSQAF